MSNKASITARIPEELLAQVEAHAQSTGKTKTDILTDALLEYLGGEGSNTEAVANLQQQLYEVQRLFLLRIGTLEGRISFLEQINQVQPTSNEIPQISPESRRITTPRLLPAKQAIADNQVV
ncbi:MAG: CopG family transcriptional regulator [Leptolyngbya sp. SIO4C1]|nr:CopG family transcriptional regulator [Leptolyngbya sp. SIO4C1]